jgi:hypothetical protein
MSEILTLEIPDDLANRARTKAAATNRGVAEVVLDWIRHAADDIDVPALSDEALLKSCDSSMSDSDQEQLSDLLASQREGELSASDRSRLDQLMSTYRRGIVLKAHALKEAVAREIKPKLSDYAASHNVGGMAN